MAERSGQDSTLDDAQRHVLTDPIKAVKLALEGSKLHAQAVLASLRKLPATVLPKIIDMFAETIQLQGDRVTYDSDGYFELHNMDIAILVIFHVNTAFYACHPDTHQNVYQSLPSLYAWMMAATNWVLKRGDDNGPASLVERRRTLLHCIHNGIVVMHDLGVEGMRFIWEQDVYCLAVNLWSQLRGFGVREEVIVARTLMYCKTIFFEEAPGGIIRKAPRSFGEYVLERCVVDRSQTVALAKEHVLRARTPPSGTANNEFVETQLMVLATLIDTPGPTWKSFIEGGGIEFVMSTMSSGTENEWWGVVGQCAVILDGVCSRSPSTEPILAALKDRLLQNLKAGTQHLSLLKAPAIASLRTLIQRILPDAMLFRSVIDRCAAIKKNRDDFGLLSSDNALADSWSHVIQLYDARRGFYESLIPIKLRRCDNSANQSLKSFPNVQGAKCAFSAPNRAKNTHGVMDIEKSAREYVRFTVRLLTIHICLASKLTEPIVSAHLSPRETKGIFQLAHNDVQSYIEHSQHAPLGLHIHYQQRFVQGCKDASLAPKIVILHDTDPTVARGQSVVAKTARGVKFTRVKITFPWNNEERTLLFEDDFGAE
ncbi:hypothetical protein SCHPADRAFT_897067 [Schizopora paradoxa]|uniref:Uncharacterized protein n=1 Tax=Schizopora paradoxa TaxID=27342 RepID=A0A0H2QYA8_9AGAM|nr:hypothetical protein SCHPADRAFT_897067 [Schizopora paradoxa]